MDGTLADSQPVVLETLAKTDFRQAFGMLTHEVSEGRCVLRVHDQYGRVFYVSREVPPSVAAIVADEPPLTFPPGAGHAARVTRPAAAVLAPLTAREIQFRFGVRLRTAQQWGAWARRQARLHGTGAVA
jgi:hypothetical protein